MTLRSRLGTASRVEMSRIPWWAERSRSGCKLVGWGVTSPERALLVRLVALAAGLAIVGTAAEIALARHAPRAPRLWKARMRTVGGPLLLLAGLALAGLLFASRG